MSTLSTYNRSSMLSRVPNFLVAACVEFWAKEEVGRKTMAESANKRVSEFSFFIEVQGMKLILIEKSIFAKFSSILRG
jgi:hypothetical protein